MRYSYDHFKTIQWFLLKYKSLQLEPLSSLGCLGAGLTRRSGGNNKARPARRATTKNQQDFWEWQNLGRNPAYSRPFIPGVICQINFNRTTVVHSISRVNVKFSCLNNYLFQSYPKKFIGHNFQSCWLLKFSKKKNCCQFFGEKKLNFYLGPILGSKIFVSRAQLLAKLQGLRLFYFHLL